MEDQVDLPAGGNAKSECHAGYHLLNLEWASLLHLEFSGPCHVRLVISSQTLSPTFQGVNLDMILSFIFC